MMPDAELAVIRQCITKETAIVGRTRERHRLLHGCGINNDVYTVAEGTRCGIEINAVEIIMDSIKF